MTALQVHEKWLGQYQDLATTAYECKSKWKDEAEKLEEGPLDVITIEFDEYSA
jgi:hypothetical protein